MRAEPIRKHRIVAIQPGHFEIEQLPEELSPRRGDTGTSYGSVREADINKAVADALMRELEGQGWKAVCVPATTPPGLRADAFISLHVDFGGNHRLRGWKLSPPWRPSRASRRLASSMIRSFESEPGLQEDKSGITIYMRGYFSFNYRRYRHAISPYTPAVLIELGRIANDLDRELLTTRPDFWADLVIGGLRDYFDDQERSNVADLRPMELPWVEAGPEGAAIRRGPHPGSERPATLDAGELLIPVDESGAWYEVFLRRQGRTGWVLKGELTATAQRRWTWHRGAAPPN